LKKKIIIVVFIIFFIGAGAFVYFGQRNGDQNELFFSGTIETTQSNMSFQIPGRIVTVNVREGQPVIKDQIIAELDRADYQSRYDQAKANLDRAQQAKQQAEIALSISKKTLPSEVARAQAGVKSAQDTLADAEKNYRRFEDLFSQGVVTEKERDAMKLGYDVAKSRLNESQSLLSLAQGNLTKIDAARQEIETAAAQINVVKASLNQAAIQLDYTQLRAPQNGVVTSRNIEPGETVNAGREVLTISDLERVDLKIYVDETQIGKVKPGQKVDVKVDTFPNKNFAGVVAFVSPEGEFTPKIIQTKKERVKLVYRVLVSIDNPAHELKAGMPADAWLK
jgi:HlyD family secretion protein